MKIAVTGPNGRLGSELVNQGCTPLDVEINNREMVSDALQQEPFDTLINCAAYTAVDAAEEDDEEGALFGANIKGVGVLRQEFMGYLIHISTGYVFDGGEGNYIESDIPAPLNKYGRSKFAGEQAALMREPTCVVRTLDLFGHNKQRSDFVRAVRNLLSRGNNFTMPNNLFGNPTYIPSLAGALLHLAEKRSTMGILHIAGETILTRFQLALKIAARFDYDPELIRPTSKIKGAASRPQNASISVGLAKSMGIPILDIDEALEEYHKEECAEIVDEPTKTKI